MHMFWNFKTNGVVFTRIKLIFPGFFWIFKFQLFVHLKEKHANMKQLQQTASINAGALYFHLDLSNKEIVSLGFVKICFGVN